MPAFNERDRIGRTLASIAEYRRRHGLALPILVGDDGSTDGTAALAEEIARRLGLDLGVLSLPHRGKAWTVRAGMLEAARRFGVQYLLMLDADDEISIDQLDKVAWQNDPSTVYIAQRVGATNGTTAGRPRPLRRLMSAGMRVASRLLLGLTFSDTQCGFKLFPSALVPALFGQQRSSSWVFDAEILTIACRISNLPVREIPVTWQPRGTSRVRATAAVTSGFALLAIAARAWAGRYRTVRPPAMAGSGEATDA